MVEISMESYIVFLIRAFWRILILLLWTILKILICLCASENLNLSKKYGKWAVITGSTDGIGKEYAKELAKRNINVVLISRNIEKLNKVKNEIQKINSTIEIVVIEADFSKGQDELAHIETKIQDIPVGILVNNVGRMTDNLDYHGKFPEKDLWDMVIINDGGLIKMTHMFVEKMKARRKGAIVNISSAAGLMPIPLQAVYSSSKIFVTYFSDAIREEYAKDGITVQNLAPFYLNTKLADFIPAAKTHAIIYPDAAKYVKSAIRTLGILDSTSGYWVHELFTFYVLFIPMWLRTKLSFIHNRIILYYYFKDKNKMKLPRGIIQQSNNFIK